MICPRSANLLAETQTALGSKMLTVENQFCNCLFTKIWFWVVNFEFPESLKMLLSENRIAVQRYNSSIY